MLKKTMMVLSLMAGMMAGRRSAAHAEEWAAKQGPLMTRWAKEVLPEKVWGEYPRPQMVRADWMNLNGVWEYRKGQVGEKVGFGTDLGGRILVPFGAESALSGVMEHLDRILYRRVFKVPGDWAGKRVLLHFGAVDWGCTVYVNKKKLGTHRGGYDAFSYDVTDKLKKGDAEQEVEVVVWDPTDGGDQPRGKQVNEPKGIFYTPTSGIWQTVWLEPVPEGYVHELKIVPDVDKSEVAVTIDAGPRAAGSGEISVTVTDDGGKVVGEASGLDVRVKVPNAKLWSPESPHLYDVTVKMGNDTVKSYFGMRKIAVAKDEKGVNRIMLNGKPVFEVGMLDQGFWPDGIYTAPTDEAMKFDIEQQKKLGFNLIRKHVKVEPARWYYWCDKLGMLVWQDMPSGDNKTDQSKEEYRAELTRMIQTHWNSPSIIMWVVFNEGWGEFDAPKIVELAKKLDPTRLVDNASGWTDSGAGDVVDMHLYPGPGCPKTEEKRAAVLGEFGGLGLAVEGHSWGAKNFSYSGQESAAELTQQYSRLLSKAWQLNASAGLCACVYTQTTDVEGEINGLMTYDRVLKGDAKAIRAANLGKGPVFETTTVVPSAMDAAQTWRYTTDKPAGEDWTKPGFDDSAWKSGPSGFGTGGENVRTKWETADIWLRREIELPAGMKAADLKLWISHDDGCEVYLNGVLATRRKHAGSGYEEQPLTKEAQAAVHEGKNWLAVHANNIGGPGVIDAGVVKVTEKPSAAAGK